jgi:hypothetical protein
VLSTLAAIHPGQSFDGSAEYSTLKYRPLITDVQETALTVKWSHLPAEISGGTPITGFKSTCMNTPIHCCIPTLITSRRKFSILSFQVRVRMSSMGRSRLLVEDMKHHTSQWMPMLNGQDRVGKFAEHKSCSSRFYCEWIIFHSLNSFCQL